jgi:hypothetical protein
MPPLRVTTRCGRGIHKGPSKGIGIVAVLGSQPLASNELIDLGFA